MPNLLLTGATGFLGQHLSSSLQHCFRLTTLGRSPHNDIPCNIGEHRPAFGETFDWVVHNAGKAHLVPGTSAEKEDFYRVNYQGTLHLLQGLEQLEEKPRQFIFISTVAVYGREKGEQITESHPLNGTSAYAKSKIQAEQAVLEWCQKYSIDGVILRLPLVAGQNPPGNLGSIIRAIQRGKYFKIARNPARKSLVLASDVAALIPKLEGKSGIFNITDGCHPSFSAIEDAIADGLEKSIPLQLPLRIVRLMAKGGDVAQTLHIPFPLTTSRLQKMTQSLTFSDERATRELDWEPQPVLEYFKQGKFINNK